MTSESKSVDTSQTTDEDDVVVQWKMTKRLRRSRWGWRWLAMGSVSIHLFTQMPDWYRVIHGPDTVSDAQVVDDICQRGIRVHSQLQQEIQKAVPRSGGDTPIGGFSNNSCAADASGNVTVPWQTVGLSQAANITTPSLPPFARFRVSSHLYDSQELFKIRLVNLSGDMESDILYEVAGNDGTLSGGLIESLRGLAYAKYVDNLKIEARWRTGIAGEEVTTFMSLSSFLRAVQPCTSRSY